MSRTFVLGDIHGTYLALIEILNKSNFDKKKDRLIFLGDIGDRYPDIDKCIDELLTIENLIFIRGNHDQLLLDHYGDKTYSAVMQYYKRYNQIYTIEQINDMLLDNWKQVGGHFTLDCYRNRIPKEHLDLVKSSIPYFECDNKLYVHGGYDENWNIEEQDPDDLMWNRNFIKRAHDLHDKDPNIKLGIYDEIFIGHTPTFIFYDNNDNKILYPTKWTNVWQVDTGAGYGDYLSMMNVDTHEIFRSSNIKQLYD